MFKLTSLFSGILKRMFVLMTLSGVIFWSLGLAEAATSVAVSTTNLINGNFPGAPVPASSPAIAIVKLSLTPTQNATLTSVTAQFANSGDFSGFATSDLAAIATGDTSGVALYNDAGATAGSFDGTDAVVTLAVSPDWTPSTTNITLTPATPVAMTASVTSIFYVVIKTSGTIGNGDKIQATIPINGVVTSDGSGPATAFIANFLLADTAPAQISAVEGFVGNATVTVRFNKPVQKVGGGNLVLADSPFTFTDGGGTAQTITAISHTAGQNFATLTMSGNLDAQDLDGTPATLAAGSNKIADMGGNVLGTGAVNLSSPLEITTPVIPTATVGTVYNNATPLVALAAQGGTAPYTFTANAAVDTTTLTNAGLSIANDGGTFKLTGTVLNIPGSYQLTLKVTDSAGTPLTATRPFNLNIAPAGGGGVPGLTNVNPPGGPQGAVNMALAITGANTSFSGASTVQFLLNGSNDTNLTVSSLAAPSGTSLTFNLTIAGGAALGSRDVKVTTGSELVIMPNGFGVFASGASGLTLQFPTDAATGIQIPPGLSFNPTGNASVNTYRVIVKSTSDFAGMALWDYAFPKPADAQNTNGSHCNSNSCNLGYGNGQFRVITQPAALSPNTTYYWQVKTYSETPFTLDTATSVAVESTPVRSFTTTASLTDVTPPTIQHRPIFQATTNATLNVFARVMDNLATATTTPALTTTLYHCRGAACTPSGATGSAAGSSIGAGYFRYQIPVAAQGIDTTGGAVVRYFLEASDGTNTGTFKQPDNSPFQLTTVAAGLITIAGTIKDGTDTCIAGVRQAVVFADGTGFNATSSNDANCTFTLSGLTAGTYDLIAVKDGFSDRRIDGVPAGATGIGFKLSSGFTGGFGGDTTKPKVKFTGPMDGMTNMPGNDTNFKVFAVFDKTMSQTSVTTAGNMTVNEVNLATGALTDITTTKGAWTYYPTNPNTPPLPPENNMAVWSFTAGQTFGDNKTIAVVVTQNVTDTAGNSIQGNQSDGSYVFTFTTSSTANFTNFNSSTGTFAGGGTFGQGAFMPPHVTGGTPPPGAINVPLNTKIVINFSDPMADDGGGYILKNFFKVFSVAGTTETDLSSNISTVTLDSGKTNATLTLTGNLTASTNYRLKVLGGAKAATGMTIMPPDQANSMAFMADFKTGTASDTAAPAVLGFFPASGATGVAVNVGGVNVGFSKDMDVSTITTSTFYLSVGSTVVNGTVEYRAIERQAYFVPKSALTPNTTYTITVTTGVTALNGTALASNQTATFTTGAGDTVAPSVAFVNADDFNLAITFSEPMNSAKATDTLNYAASVIKAGNFALKYGAAGFNPASAGTVINIPTSASFTYDQVTSTMSIQGYHDSAIAAATLQGQEIYVAVSNTKDISGNAIDTTNGANTGKAPIKNSSTTKGALGPMAMAGDAFSGEGGFVPMNFSSTTFGFAPPVEVRPFNMMAGVTTIYGVRLPISTQIPAGGAIVLTFPTGFDVGGAMQDVNSPMRTDLNGPGTGTVTFKCQTNVAGGKSCATTANADDTGAAQGGLADDGVVVNTATRTVTVYLAAATNTEGHDFLTIDIAGIKNSTVPRDFNTAGYTVDIKTKNGTTVLESLTSQSFFIQSAGTNTLSGTITATGNDQSGTMQVFLMSPMTGPQEVTSANFAGGATAAYSFPNLPNGDFMLFTDQTITLGTKEFTGKTMPERVLVSGNTTYNFTLANNTTGGTNLTVRVDGPSSEKIDIFAGSPTGFKVIQKTLDANAGFENFTFNLANGSWFVGVGPQMPKGPMSGPPPAPSYLPPRPVDVTIAAGPVFTENSGTANDGIIQFTLTSASKTIKGVVKDGANKVIANAEVYAYSPSGGFGTHAQADSTGTFTLNVTDGTYSVGAFVPGMPPSKEVPVTVTDDATTYLLIDGSLIPVTPAAAATSFILKVAKPDYTISGKVTDGTNVVQGASVYAYRSDGPGFANANTDSAGAYTLYVSNGTWKVGVFLPQYGNLTELTVVVNGASVSNQNFSPTNTGTFYTVSGRAYKDITVGGGFNGSDEAMQGVFVRIVGNNTFNEAITGAEGTYSFKVPGGNGYQLKAFAPGIGELSPLAAFNVAADTANKDFAITPPRTITFTFSSAPTQAYIDLFAAAGFGGHTDIANKTTATLSLSDGSYRVDVHIPGVNIGLTDIAATTGDTVYSNTTGIVTVDGNEGLTVTLPTLRTVSGTVKVGTTNVADAWVEIVNQSNGVHFGTKSGTDGTFSLQVADSATSYFINAMKPGYFREPTTLTVNGADVTGQTLTMSAATTTIAGQVLIGSTGAANAFVRAERQGGGFSGTQADANGNYTLPVSSGVWRVFGVAEGYAEAPAAANPIDVTGGSVTGKNIALTTTVSLNPPKSKPLTPASGGTLEDTTAGVKLTIPANAFGSSTSAGNVQSKETNNVRETDSARPLGGKAKEIKATDSDGSPINTLNDAITVEMSYTLAEVTAVASATDSSINTKAEADALSMAYWDETTANWVTLPSTVTYKDASANVITDATTIDTAAEFAANVATVLISAPTEHLSLYAPVVSTSAQAPSTPTGFVVTATTSSTVSLSWTQVSGATSYDIYRSTTSGGTFSRLGSEPTISSGSTTTYTDTGLTAGTTYYYKITALNASGESAATAEQSAATTGGGSGSGGGGGSPVYTAPSAAPTTPATTAPTTPEAATPTTTAASYELISAPGDPKVYVVKNGQKTWIRTPAEFNAAGYDWNDVQVVELSALAAYPDAEAAAPSPAPAPTGYQLMRASGDPKVYVVKDGQKTWITSAAAFNAAGYNWADVQVVAPATLAGYPEVAAPTTPTLAKFSPIAPGTRSDAVKTLQQFLVDQGVYPEALVTSYYGSLTRAAVQRFQEKYGIARPGQAGYGVFGPKTSAQANELLGY